MIQRFVIDRIHKIFAIDKAVLLLGPRQVGNTTLLMEHMKSHPASLFLDCDEPDIRNQLTGASSTSLNALIGTNSLVIIDEAHRVKNIGVTLKLITDKIKGVKLIVSGSSSFELSSDINEPHTIRKIELNLFGFSTEELVKHHSEIEENRLLEQRLIYGLYAEVVDNSQLADSLLIDLVNSNIYKVIFQFQAISKPELLPDLLEVLARHVDSEVSYNELAGMLNSDPETIRKSIVLLEYCLVVFKLRSFRGNLKNELKKSRKLYFYDNGIKNGSSTLGKFYSKRKSKIQCK